MKVFVKLFILALTLLLTSQLVAATLSNGLEPIVEADFTLSYLSSKQIDHKTERALKKVAKEIQEVITKARKHGIQIERKVHVRFLEDVFFPCRDLWLAAGVDPSDEAIADLRQCAACSFEMTDYVELNEHRFATDAKYHFLTKFIGCEASSQEKLENYEDEIFVMSEDDAKKAIDKLATSLHEPLGDHLRLYMVPEHHCYVPWSATIWIPHPKRKRRLHRDIAAITHEVGHHVFASLGEQIAKSQAKSRSLSILQRCLLEKSLLAYNELFADYSALTSGNNIVLPLHLIFDDGSLPDEVKRYFSKRRTLAEFIAEARASGEQAQYYVEGHNSLNPTRSFLWQLKHDLRKDIVDGLLFAATKTLMTEFYQVDVHKYDRSESDMRGEQIAYLLDYPADIVSVNLRFLLHLRAAAHKQLDREKLAIFQKLARDTYGESAIGAD